MCDGHKAPCQATPTISTWKYKSAVWCIYLNVIRPSIFRAEQRKRTKKQPETKAINSIEIVVPVVFIFASWYRYYFIDALRLCIAWRDTFPISSSAAVCVCVCARVFLIIWHTCRGKSIYFCSPTICAFTMFQFVLFAVKPTSINITSKPKHFASEIEYSINCEVDGSIPETDIRWTQNNRPFNRARVSKFIASLLLLFCLHLCMLCENNYFSWSHDIQYMVRINCAKFGLPTLILRFALKFAIWLNTKISIGLFLFLLQMSFVKIIRHPSECRYVHNAHILILTR